MASSLAATRPAATRRRVLRLLDDRATARDAFDVGECIYVAADGLRPNRVYELWLRTGNDARADRLLACLCADRHGHLPATLVLPWFGLIAQDADPEGESPCLDHDRGEQRMAARAFTLRAIVQAQKARPDAAASLRVARAGQRPQLIASDERGRLQTGMLAGQQPVVVTLRHLRAGCVRVFLVPRQFDWRIGDPIAPVLDDDGTPVVVTRRVDDAGHFTLTLWPRERVRPGSYQFIARSFIPGWHEADDLRLLADDIVSSRRVTSLVVRRRLDQLGLWDNGVVLTPEIAGRPLAHRPYFEFVNNFPRGTDVWAALDPAALPPGLVGQKAAIHVIAHKTADDWTASSALTDVSGPGMSPAAKVVPIVPGCVNWNRTLVWPNPQQTGHYDIVIDFGNNVADPSQFAIDGTLDAGLDMIDGYVRVGFHVTDDPSLPGPYAGAIGQHSYNDGTVQVPSTDAGPQPTDALPLTAVVRYPAQVSGIDAPLAAGAFPLVVVMHGNSGMQTSYLGYNYLLDHLAGHGFIAVSIYAPVGVMIETRARAILQHLSLMAQKNTAPGLFHNHVDLTRIGIAGHSRGGEAVVRASRINVSEGLGWDLRAAVSIAPTDYHHHGDPFVPLLVVYGSNDGDVSGAWPDRTCFNIYDEAGKPRSFVFVYGATHDGFNTEWASSGFEYSLEIAPSDLPKLISQTDHENVAKGYVAGFFQLHLQGRAEQVEYFQGLLKPTLVASIAIHNSHQAPGGLLLDNFEQLDAATNTLGGAVTTSALPSPPDENQLHALDAHSPHVTAGGRLGWNSVAGKYVSTLPAAQQDVSAFVALAFRVTQKYGSLQNPPNQPQDFSVRLADLDGRSRAIRVSVFTDVPFPYERGHVARIKSALKTVRIPLASFTIANLGADNVDITRLHAVSFEFDARPTGEVEIDEIEFTP
jgi:dienelactone hydrolase